MKLTSNVAISLIKAHENNRTERIYLIEHQLAVGNAAGRIAKALGMDEDKAKSLGYIHDIGKVFCEDVKENRGLAHGIRGYDYIKSLGYDEEYARICILHSYLNNDIDCLSGDITNRNGEAFEFQYNYVTNHHYDDYEKLINLCDLMCTNKILTVDKRMMDLLIRHGVFKTTHYHLLETVKLKEYFDQKLGYNLYDLFPEIKKNL